MDILTSVYGVAGNIALLAISTDEVTTWVTCICAGLITVVTTIVQVYRLWRDRDSDKTDSEDDKTNKDNEE